MMAGILSKVLTGSHLLVPRRLYKRNSKKPVYLSLTGEVLYGIQPVQLALSARRRTVHCLYYNPGSVRTQKLVQVCQERGVVCKEVDRAGLTDICMQMDRSPCT